MQGRGGQGLKNYNITEKTGKVCGAKLVYGHEDVILISDDGTTIRMATDSISRYSRVTQGVRVMHPMPGARVLSLARADREEEEDERTEE